MSQQPTTAEVLKVSVSGERMYITVRCPHCNKKHWHGGGAGHRLAHCAGQRAEKLRRQHGSLEYEITQHDIDHHLGAAA